MLPAVVTDRVRQGTCFVPFHWSDEQGANLAVNAVTSDAVDPDSLQPEFKACAVAVRPVGAAPVRTVAVTQPVAVSSHMPLVLWASQTGNAQELATRLVDHLGGQGVTVASASMGEVTPDRLVAHVEHL